MDDIHKREDEGKITEYDLLSHVFTCTRVLYILLYFTIRLLKKSYVQRNKLKVSL